jgi:hypothetical protein
LSAISTKILSAAILFLTFKDVKEDHWKCAYDNIVIIIANEFERHAAILQQCII